MELRKEQFESSLHLHSLAQVADFSANWVEEPYRRKSTLHIVCGMLKGISQTLISLVCQCIPRIHDHPIDVPIEIEHTAVPSFWGWPGSTARLPGLPTKVPTLC